MHKGLAASLTLGVALACGLACGARPAPAASPLKAESGRLQELIGRLASSDYVLGEPTRDRRPYVDPSALLNAFRHAAAALAWGDVEDAARRAEKLDYEVVKFTDRQTRHEYLVMREDLSRLKAARGWGSYIFNPESRIDVLVEAPHPVADAQTPEIGGLVFEEAGARGFLLAGAHRDKADVPDLVDSVFHQVHTAWIGPTASVAAWQVHGFASYKHSFPDGAHVVASTGDGVIVPEITSLDALCEDKGLVSYVYNDRPAESRANRRLNGDVPGVTFSSLAAATNEQGRLSRSLGGSFVHVELESSVRMDAAQRETVASVIAAAMSGAPARTPEVEADAEVELASHESAADEAPAELAAAEAEDAAAEPRLAANVSDVEQAQLSGDESRQLTQ